MRVFVGCSSRNEIPKNFLSLAESVGNLLREQGHEVIIGGTLVGMMGCVAKNILPEKITQIILKDYVEEGVLPSKSFMVCDSSFERMKLIWENADIFVMLPGGTGTLGEIIFFLEENRAKSDKKPILVFNEQDYYRDIINFIEQAKKLQFSNEDILEGLTFVQNLSELSLSLERLK